METENWKDEQLAHNLRKENYKEHKSLFQIKKPRLRTEIDVSRPSLGFSFIINNSNDK